MSLEDKGYEYLKMFKSVLRKYKNEYLEMVCGDVAIFELPGLDDDENVASARMIILMEEAW